jgi:GGDEF domain-containing protein
VSVSSVLDEDGSFSGIFLVMRDPRRQAPPRRTRVTGLQEMTHRHALRLYQAEARLQHLSYYDPLTDLGNRHLLQERLTLEIETARVNHHVLALLFIDLDGFKLINDNLGHSAGDLLLKLSADRIRHCLRPETSPSGWGQTNFWCCCPPSGDPGSAGSHRGVATQAARSRRHRPGAGEALRQHRRLPLSGAWPDPGQPHQRGGQRHA